MLHDGNIYQKNGFTLTIGKIIYYSIVVNLRRPLKLKSFKNAINCASVNTNFFGSLGNIIVITL